VLASFPCTHAWSQESDVRSAEFVLVVPAPHCGSAAICRLCRSSSSSATGASTSPAATPLSLLAAPSPATLWFDFQRLRYCHVTPTHNDDSSGESDVCFQRLRFPIHDPIVELAKCTGWASKTDLDVARRTWGSNDVETPLPLFWDLFREHALAPFFVFQVRGDHPCRMAGCTSSSFAGHCS
jgi:cation-transporting ATPase 13A1